MLEFFPPCIGLDISEGALKAAALKPEGRLGFSWAGFGRAVLKEGSVRDGLIKDEDDLSRALLAVLDNREHPFLKTKHLVVSLPEDKVFLRIVDLPALKKGELEEAVKLEVEANIPLSLSEVYYDYEIVNGGGSVMVNAAPKAVVDSYTGFFERQGYRLLALEIDVVASARALLGRPQGLRQDSAALVLDIGDVKTRFVMAHGGTVRFTSSGDVAGNAFTSALASRLGVDAKEAELMKKLVGINRNHERGQEFLEIFSPLLTQLKDQIQHHVSFFETHTAVDKAAASGRRVSRIILAGGGANLAGLSDWLSQQLGLVVMPANPLKSWNISGRGAESTMSWEESLSYATAIGSALRSQDISVWRTSASKAAVLNAV